MPLLTTGAGVYPAAGGGGATLTYTPTATAVAWDDTGTGSFAGVAIGTVAADRIIVVSIALVSNTAANGRPSSVTCGGVAMTNATGTSGETPSGGGAGTNNYIYYLAAPSGVLNATTATIVVTTPFSSNYSISVGVLNGSAAASVNAFNGNAWSGGGTVADPRGVANDLAAVAVASGGIVVTSAQIDRSGTYVASGSTITIDRTVNDIGSPNHQHVQGHGTSGSPAITGATNFNANFAIASFKP